MTQGEKKAQQQEDHEAAAREIVRVVDAAFSASEALRLGDKREERIVGVILPILARLVREGQIRAFEEATRLTCSICVGLVSEWYAHEQEAKPAPEATTLVFKGQHSHKVYSKIGSDQTPWLVDCFAWRVHARIAALRQEG